MDSQQAEGALTREECERRVLAEYKEMLGKTVLFSEVDAHPVGEEYSDSVMVRFDPPAKFSVMETDRDSLLRWIDPYWELAPDDPEDEHLPLYEGYWSYGTSINWKTGETQQSHTLPD